MNEFHFFDWFTCTILWWNRRSVPFFSASLFEYYVQDKMTVNSSFSCPSPLFYSKCRGVVTRSGCDSYDNGREVIPPGNIKKWKEKTELIRNIKIFRVERYSHKNGYASFSQSSFSHFQSIIFSPLLFLHSEVSFSNILHKIKKKVDLPRTVRSALFTLYSYPQRIYDTRGQDCICWLKADSPFAGKALSTEKTPGELPEGVTSLVILFHRRQTLLEACWRVSGVNDWWEKGKLGLFIFSIWRMG